MKNGERKLLQHQMRCNNMEGNAVREFANKSAASAASLDYVKFEAVINSAASAASLRGGRASNRLDHVFFPAFFGCVGGQKMKKMKEMCMCGGFRRQTCAFPKNKSFKMGLPVAPRPF